MAKKNRGFTILELIVVIVLLGVGSWLFFSEKSRIDATQRDNLRKISINAIYYNLEEVFYEKNHYYPADIDSKILPAMDPELLKDPDGIKINEALSSLRYTAKDCDTNSQCKGYELKSIMEREADYIKTNRN